MPGPGFTDYTSLNQKAPDNNYQMYFNGGSKDVGPPAMPAVVPPKPTQEEILDQAIKAHLAAKQRPDVIPIIPDKPLDTPMPFNQPPMPNPEQTYRDKDNAKLMQQLQLMTQQLGSPGRLPATEQAIFKGK